jgi:hypothetical protein
MGASLHLMMTTASMEKRMSKEHPDRDCISKEEIHLALMREMIQVLIHRAA